MPDLVLTGLDGTNPLSFFATLGVLEALVDESREATLRWQRGTWRPIVASEHADIEALIDRLDKDRRSAFADPALSLEYDGKRDLKPSPCRYREFLSELAAKASISNRRNVDWASAFASDVVVDNKGNTKPTALHFTAGQQQFLQMVAELAENVTTADLREAVEGPWKYQRSLPVMGWDATSSRDYALRATDPSTDKKRGVPGADWLAVRGLIFFPTFPEGNRLTTTGCVGGWKDGEFRWPLWTVPLTAPVIRTVLAQDIRAMPQPERGARGIGIMLRSGIRRSDQGGYGSFEPASLI